MRVRMVDLAATDAMLGHELRAAVDRVVRGGRFILGEEVEAFERELAAYCRVPHAVGVASGTDALILALQSHGVGAGDVVVTTPFSFIATAEAIVRAGAIPHFVDVDAATLCLDARKIDVAPRAVVPVHLYGRVADPSGWARSDGACVVADAAQAIGARLETTAALSFFPTKNLGAWGDGGAVLTHDAELAERVRALRVHGYHARAERHLDLGYNSRLDAVQAAVLRVKLRRLDWVHGRRRELARLYRALLSAADLDLPPPLGERDACHLFTVRVRERDRIRRELAAAGIDSAVYYPRLLFDHPAIARAAGGDLECPVARRASAEVLSLPVHEHLTEGDIERVATTLARSVSKSRARP